MRECIPRGRQTLQRAAWGGTLCPPLLRRRQRWEAAAEGCWGSHCGPVHTLPTRTQSDGTIGCARQHTGTRAVRGRAKCRQSSAAAAARDAACAALAALLAYERAHKSNHHFHGSWGNKSSPGDAPGGGGFRGGARRGGAPLVLLFVRNPLNYRAPASRGSLGFGKRAPPRYSYSG